MCTIFGYFGSDMTRRQAEEILARTTSRGPDETRILQIPGKGILAFQRLAIMGLTESGMQPFVREGVTCLCNGEIYGFRKQREKLREKGYAFQSDSDCEILIPLYKEYGLQMFSRLDAEFALLLWDEKKALWKRYSPSRRAVTMCRAVLKDTAGSESRGRLSAAPGRMKTRSAAISGKS